MDNDTSARPPEQTGCSSGDVVPDLTATEWVAALLAGVVATGLLVALIAVLHAYWGG